MAYGIVAGYTSEKEFDEMQREEHYRKCSECKNDGTCTSAANGSTCMYRVSAFARPTVCRLYREEK